ncbi:DUF1177 family protein [Streptomyces sp. NPDC001508]|uniref:DUF1177 family protein n=1 Tax=Streptomyces sp. NPDC001508 TaxID=3154656 RepID=UPI00331CE4CE
MLTREILDAWDLIDLPNANGATVRDHFAAEFAEESLWPTVTRLDGEHTGTDVVRWSIPGTEGNTAPTLAVIGRLGGIGVRPGKEGTVSDADGAIVATAVALKLARAHQRGEPTKGDVVIVTHICPTAPTRDHPVPGQMDSPVPIDKLLRLHESPAEADALISIDTTRSHYLINHTGIAATATLKNGVILRISPDVMKLLGEVTSEPPVALPITMQDITPLSSGLFRINSIMQPGNYFDGPVIGLASVSRHPIHGSTTGANRPENLEHAARFAVEAARRFGRGDLRFHDEAEYARFVDTYGSMAHLVGRASETADGHGDERP